MGISTSFGLCVSPFGRNFVTKKSNRINIGDPEIEFLFTDTNVLSRLDKSHFVCCLIKLRVHNSVYISCHCRRDTGHFGQAYSTLGSDSDLGHSWTKTHGLPELRFSAHRTAPMGSTS